MKAATVYDVAQRAGVSIATVSMTFRQPHRVKPATREAVTAAANALNYVPSASARGLADGRTGAFGLFSYDYFLAGPEDESSEAGMVSEADRRGLSRAIDGDSDDEACRQFPLYVDEVQRGVELECWRRGYALLIGGGRHANSATVVTDIAGRVDGLAVFPHTVPEEVLQRISRRIPVVAVSDGARDDGLSHATVDNRGGMRVITAHMIKEHGLRDLLFTGQVELFDLQERFAGFRAALRAAGLRVPRKPFAFGYDPADAGRAIGDLVARDALPEAFICATDETALRVMAALAARSIRVPQQVAVTGFDGLVAGRLARPALTTVRQPMQALGRVVVDILIERLAMPAAPPASRRLPVRLVVRESCGCASG